MYTLTHYRRLNGMTLNRFGQRKCKDKEGLRATPKIKKEYNIPKKDKVQARLTWLQLIFTLGIGAVFAIIRWYSTAEKIKPLSGILTAIVMVVFVLGLTYLNSVINDTIDELKEL